MCGIAGAVSPEPIDPRVVERMRDRLVHRGPDAAGLWPSPDGRVCLGHRRLAVIDLSEEANQPFVSADGRHVVTYNGELYNFRVLRAELERLGARFRTSSDTEVLLEAYRRFGEGCLDRLSGMFAFAIWDAEAGRLFCARDRVGEKPFYYAEIGGAFVFASELKSLLCWPSFRPELDYEAAADFFVLGCVADPKTIWRGARKLEPGHSLTVELRDGEVRVGRPRQYWDLTFAPDTSVGDWQPLIRETIEAAVSEMAYADVPVGAFLSGGVDSSSVVAALSRTGHTVSTFSAGFTDELFDERPWAREVAERYAAGHIERLVQPDDLTAVFPETVLWHYDEPYNDHSYLPTLCVSRTARESITVALTGDGGDELFAGYDRYLELANGSAKNALRGSISTCISEEQLRQVARGRLAQALGSYSPTETVLDYVQKAPPDEVGLVNSRRYVDLKLTLGSDLLVKIDRASMAVSLEVRPIYLHRDVVELAARIPPALLADAHLAKKLLKSALEPWLPAELLYRRKKGFSMPLGSWLRADLRSLLVGLDGANRPLSNLIRPAFVTELVRRHLDGNGADDDPMALALHGMVFLDHWLERWA